MARGGSREGAGRPVGATNRKTAEMIARVEASGLTPLDYMLSVLRDENVEAPLRMDAAKGAAPYCHAKLAAIDVNGELDVTGKLALQWLPTQ